MVSGNFSWDPSPEEVAATFVKLRTAMDLRQEDVAERIGTSPTTIGNYENPSPSARWPNAIRMMRFYADHAPGGGKAIADLLGLTISEEEARGELRRRIKLLRDAYQSDSPLVRANLVALEEALRAATGQPHLPLAADPREKYGGA